MAQIHFAVDTETTSLKLPYPIEIAAVMVDDLSVTYCQRIRTQAKIDPRAQAVHGISHACLAKCPEEREVMAQFVDFLRRHAGTRSIVLVAHNARFDREVIERALQRCELSLPSDTSWECTLTMSRSKMHDSNTLSACCARAGIAYEDAHCALPDAIMCAQVFKHFFEDENTALFAEALAQVNAEEQRLQSEFEAAARDYMEHAIV